MLAKNITIFSLPIDSQHQNVFDFSDKTKATGTNYYKALRQKFDYVVVKGSDQDDVSIRSDKEFDICLNIPCESVSEFAKDYISKYNYLAMSVFPYENEKTYDTFLFYFITDWKIVNSVKNPKLRANRPESGSVTVMFSLKWDVWANNLGAIQNQTNKIFFERKHIDDFKLNYDNYGARWMSKNTIESAPIDIPRMEKISDSRQMPNRQYGTIIFARLFVSTNFFERKILKWNSESKSWENVDLTYFPNREFLLPNLNVIYIPLKIVNSLTREEIKGKIMIRNADDSYTTLSKDLYSNYTGVVTRISEYIKYADTSVYFFNYDVYGTQSYIFIPNTNDGIELFNPGSDYGTSSYYFFVDTKKLRYENKRATECVYFTRNSVPQLNDKNIQIRKVFEPNLHCYPYEYLSVLQLNEEYPLIPIYNTNSVIVYEKMTGTSPAIKIEEGNEFKDFIVKQKTQNLPIVSDYLNSLLATSGKTLFGGGFLPLIFGDLKSAATNLTGTFLKIEDAKNHPSSFTSTSSNAFDNLYMDDDLIFVKNIIKDEYIEDAIFNFINLYGISLNRIDLFTSTRQNFDYQKTRECELQFIRDNTDRIEVQNIFNNGVRRWHLDTCYNDALINCDTEYINLQNSLIES